MFRTYCMHGVATLRRPVTGVQEGPSFVTYFSQGLGSR